MDNTENPTLFSATVRDLVDQFILHIISAEAPEEIDLQKSISGELYNLTESQLKSKSQDRQWLSFSGMDLHSFLTSSLMVVWLLIILPYLVKVYEKAIEKTADKTVDTIGVKINEMLKRIKGKKNKLTTDERIDILIPINWDELEREIKSAGKGMGLRKSEVEKIASLSVKELSENQVLLGELLINVKRGK